MERRGFFGAMAATLCCLFIGKAKSPASQQVVLGKRADSTNTSVGIEASYGWLKERCAMLPHVGIITYSRYEPAQSDGEGFRAVITTPTRTYHVAAKHYYLGCTSSMREPLPGEDWLRGSDLADGPRTVETWMRIEEDIMRLESH